MTKNLFVKKIAFAIGAIVLVAACEGPEGPQGPQGESGIDGTAALLSITPEAAGDNCENGGFRIDVGTDSNANGTLDTDEISTTTYACNGVDGNGFLVASTEEAAGDNCENGGFRVDSGVDDNNDGVLDAGEIDNTIYLCNGEDFVNELRGTLEPLVTMFGAFQTVSVETLISSLDTITTSGGADFNIGGSADGAGMVVNPTTGDYELLVNFEDHYAVARLTIDPVLFASDRDDNRSSLLGSVISGDYLLNSSVSDYARQCSGTMWEAAIHGGSDDIFISASETWHYANKLIDPYATPDPGAAPSDDNRLNAMGLFGWENAVPLPQNAFAGSTVIIGGDDDYKFNDGNGGGSVVMYYSDAADDDLTGGEAYVLRLVNANDGAIDGEPADESDLVMNTPYDVEFVTMSDMPDTLDTVDEWDAASVAVNALEFVRVEDLDYGKGSDAANRTMYIAVTGRGPGRGTPNDWGTGYKLELDAGDPTQGTLTKILTGNLDEANALAALQSPDNICVTENYIYWQEDPNSFQRGHQAYIWQTDLDGNGAQAVLQIDFNNALDEVASSKDSDGFSGEFGALFDISDKVNEEGVFILCLQPHYWTNDIYAGVDGHDNGFGQPSGFAPREDLQGSQIVVLRGLPR